MHISKAAVMAPIFGCLFLIIFFPCAHSQSTILTVGDKGQYASIQSAINAANASDTIVVFSGTYRENVNVNKQLSLVGEDTGKGKPIVDAGGEGSVIMLSSSGVTISGFSVTGSSPTDAGIKVVSDNDLIQDCDLYNNYYGIYLFYSNNDTIASDYAHDNSYVGIGLNQSSNNRLLNNTLSSNDHDGLRIELYSQGNIIEGNTIRDNALSSVEMESKNAITIYLSDGNMVTGNTMENNGGTVVRDSGTYRLGDGVMAMDTKGTIIKNNTMINDHYAAWIYHSTNAAVMGNSATRQYYCVVVQDSSDVLVGDNVLSRGGRNARIISSSNVTFVNNSMSDGVFDMSIDDSHDCLVTGNVMVKSKYDSLLISNSDHNVITKNRIVNTNGNCLVIQSSNSNDLYQNDLIGNTGPVSSTDSTNRWESRQAITYRYNGKIFTSYLGNKWGDYSGSDANGDDVGDTAYEINAQNIDHYPLMDTADNYSLTVREKIYTTPTAFPDDSQQAQNGFDLWQFFIQLFDALRS